MSAPVGVPPSNIPSPRLPDYREFGHLPGRDIRVMLVDDHQMMRNGLRELIGCEAGFKVVAEAADGESVVDIARRVRPDVIVMDISMPKMNGIDATRRVTMENPQARVIGLSLLDDCGTTMRRAGAAAYLTKDATFEALCVTIREVASTIKPARAMPQHGSA
jgi:DNA-binding NarL/FixJ family response regulator